MLEANVPQVSISQAGDPQVAASPVEAPLSNRFRWINSLRARIAILVTLAVVSITVLFLATSQAGTRLERAENAEDQASLQRANVYLIASFARRLLDDNSAIEAEGIRVRTLELIERFDQVQTGLRLGDEELGLEPVTSREVVVTIEESDTHWTTFRSMVETFLDATPEERIQLAPQIDSQSTLVYTFIDRVVSAFGAQRDQAAQSGQTSAGHFGALVTVVILFGAFVILQALRAVNHLGSAAERFSKGDFTARVGVTVPTEIGRVGGVFNTMAAQIDELVKNLQEQITVAETARARAERSDEVKSAFLASMSHELRTPLNSVINYSKFVVKGVMGPVNERQEEALSKVVDSGKHLLNLINDVLDVSKIESGSLNLFIEENVNLRELVDASVEIVRPMLTDKTVELNVTVDPELPTLKGDRNRIKQILVNVLSNACKFTEKGTVELVARRDGDKIHIAVKDTGVGISPEDHDAVFESFKQTHSGLRQGGGTGLGMPISRSLAEAHGGRLWFESKISEGSTFYVELPIASAVLTPTLA